MNLENPIEILVHYLLIGGMTWFDYHDEFSMVSALVYVIHIGSDLQWIMM